MVVILNENSKPETNGSRKGHSRSRHGKGWPLSSYRGQRLSAFNRRFPTLMSEPSSRIKFAPSVKPRWHGVNGQFLSHSMSSVAPASPPVADEPCQSSPATTAVQAPLQPTRTGLYMRMTLAERDSLIKHHVAGLPLYAYHLLGAYQDPHQNTMIVLADMRQSSLACSSTQFIGDEALVVSSVVLPLLQHIAVLHSYSLGHHHLSPWHVFIASEHARCLTCTLPCPAAHPDQVNQLLADAVPAEYFAPEAWETCGGGPSEGGVAALLKCDLWAVGMITVTLLGGSTTFLSHNYSSLVRGSHQSGALGTSCAQQACTPPSTGSRAILSRAVQAVSAVFPQFGSLIGGLSRVGTRNSCQGSSTDDAEDADVRGCATCLKATALHTLVLALVDQQLTVLQQFGTSPDLLALLRGLLEPDPLCRFSASDALAHSALGVFVRGDAAGAFSGPTHCVDAVSAAPPVARQLWGVVRQSRQQLVEMSRRETLVSTLAERRDALERFAHLVTSTLSGESPHAALDTPTQIGKPGVHGAAGTGGNAATGVLHQPCDPWRHVHKVSNSQAFGGCKTALSTGSNAKVSSKDGDIVTDESCCSSPKQCVPVHQQQRCISESSRSGKTQRCMSTSSSARKWSGRVRFSGTGDAMASAGHLPVQRTATCSLPVAKATMPSPDAARLYHPQDGGMSVLVNANRLG